MIGAIPLPVDVFLPVMPIGVEQLIGWQRSPKYPKCSYL